MKRLLLAASFVAAALPAAADGLDVALGKALFERPWTAAGASNTRTDGLGPMFNARACSSCHLRGGAGRMPDEDGRGLGLVLRFADDPIYGRQLQTNGVQGQVAEGRLDIAWESRERLIGDGTRVELRRPSWAVLQPGYGPPPAAGSLRLAPSLRGIGLIARIPQGAIQSAAAEPKPDGVTGQVPTGRFGLRGTHGDLASQTSEAFLLDLGLATLDHPEPWGDCTPAQRDCRHALQGASAEGGAELDQPVVAAIVSYLEALPPPAPSASPDPVGRDLFASTGCTACHRPSLAGVPAWSDLLLHRMGDGLADGGGDAWRTAPLWGLGARLRGKAPLLHDGRARDALEAILWHDGEAAAARERFAALAPGRRDALFRFLEGL